LRQEHRQRLQLLQRQLAARQRRALNGQRLVEPVRAEITKYLMDLGVGRRGEGEERRDRYDADEFRSVRPLLTRARKPGDSMMPLQVKKVPTLLIGIVGGLIVAFGLVTIPLPGPGWLTVIAGLFVLATEFTWAERLLEFTKKQVKRWTDWVTSQPVWVRVVIALATAAFVYGVVVLVLHVFGVPDWVPGWVPLWH